MSALTDLRTRVAFLESVNDALRSENARFRTGDNDPLVASLTERLVRAEKERDAANKKELEKSLALSDAEFLIAMLKQERADARQSPGKTINKTIWRRLIQLVHPDKHDGSQAAHAATLWLMENRP